MEDDLRFMVGVVRLWFNDRVRLGELVIDERGRGVVGVMRGRGCL